MADKGKTRLEQSKDLLKALNGQTLPNGAGDYQTKNSPPADAPDTHHLNSALIEQDKQKRLAPLQEEHGELSNALAEFESTDPDAEIASSRNTVETAARQMEMIADRCVHVITNMAQKACAAEALKRKFQADNNVFRDVKAADLLPVMALISLFFTLETGITALSLFADGHMDLAPAMGFAAMFSLINITLGLGAGFTARFIGYRANHARQLAEYQLVRNMAIGGVAAMVLLHILILFIAGRVRVTGSHGAVFDFSDADFFATFGDGMGLLIMIAAMLSFSVSMYKGFNALLDRIPEYDEYAPKVDFDAQAASQAEQAIDHIDDIFDDTELQVDDLLDEQEEAIDLPKDISDFNADVMRERGKHKVFALSVYEREKFIQTGGKIKPPAFDLTDFDALLLKPPVKTRASLDKSLLSDLQAAQSKAASRITDALSQYHAEVQAFRTPPSSLF